MTRTRRGPVALTGFLGLWLAACSDDSGNRTDSDVPLHDGPVRPDGGGPTGELTFLIRSVDNDNAGVSTHIASCGQKVGVAYFRAIPEPLWPTIDCPPTAMGGGGPQPRRAQYVTYSERDGEDWSTPVQVDQTIGPTFGLSLTYDGSCTAYIGPDGAGHYVKMVHNGIEYGDMQMICEAYDLMRKLLGMSAPEIADVFKKWNTGVLDSFLIEITGEVLAQKDPMTGGHLVDLILDTAGQKGTGKWTSVSALDMGVPAPTVAEAVFARCISAVKDERVAASKILTGPDNRYTGDKEELIEAIHAALYCSKICSYAQGFQLMREAQKEYGWTLDFGKIAQIFRGGCIIRAVFLQKITEAFELDGQLANLLLDPYFKGEVEKLQPQWRKVVATAALQGVPAPCMGSALTYYDGYRSEKLPANLLQGQRDYFGAHTYERTDQPRGKFFHIDWPEPGRPQLEI